MDEQRILDELQKPAPPIEPRHEFRSGLLAEALQAITEPKTIETAMPMNANDSLHREPRAAGIRSALHRPTVAVLASFVAVTTVVGGALLLTTVRADRSAAPVAESPLSETSAPDTELSPGLGPNHTTDESPGAQESTRPWLPLPQPNPPVDAFLPTATIESDSAMVPLAFSDGTLVDLFYPAEWAIAERGWRPKSGLSVEGRSGVSSQALFAWRGVVDIATGATPDRVLVGDQGREAQLWASDLPEDSGLLVISFGDWTVTLIEGEQWTDDDRLAIVNNLDAHEDLSGFLILDPTPPLSHLTASGSFRPTLQVGDLMTLTAGCYGAAEDAPIESAPESVTWCDTDAEVTITFWAPPQFHDTIRANIDVLPVDRP